MDFKTLKKAYEIIYSDEMFELISKNSYNGTSHGAIEEVNFTDEYMELILHRNQWEYTGEVVKISVEDIEKILK